MFFLTNWQWTFRFDSKHSRQMEHHQQRTLEEAETGGGLGGAPATRTSGKRLASGAQALGREARRALSSEKMLRCPGTPGRTMDVISPVH